MKSYESILEEVESHTDELEMALGHLLREFVKSPNVTFKPTREEFLQALDFISKMLSEEDIVCLKGPEMEIVDGTGEEIANWLLERYDNEGYDSINFGIFFTKKEYYT